MPLVVLFVFWVVGGVLMVVWVGALFLAGRRCPATRWLANAHRRMASDGARPAAAGAVRPARRAAAAATVRRVATDPMTWRDLGWMLVAMTLGFVISLIVVVLLLGGRHLSGSGTTRSAR